MNLPSDFADLLQAFDEFRADYMIVGGYAVAFHGAPRFTKDLDIFIRDEKENIGRVVSALTAFGAPPVTLQAIKDLQGLDVAWLGNPPLRIDFMTHIPGIDYQQAATRKLRRHWGEKEVCVISLKDLLTTKAASGRPQDVVDIDLLRKANPTDE